MSFDQSFPETHADARRALAAAMSRFLPHQQQQAEQERAPDAWAWRCMREIADALNREPGADGGQTVAERMGVPFLGTIPIDPAVRLGGDGGVPIVVGAPESPAAVAIARIASELAGRVSVLNLSRPVERTFAADPDLAILG